MNNLFSKSILRTPVYSLQDYNYILSLDKNSLFSYLQEDEFFLYALYTSSPSLHSAFISITYFDQQIHNKILLSCYKYYVRMCTRCVPFGMFSGISVINHSINIENTHIIRDELIKTHTRLDSTYYNMLCKSFEKKIFSNLKFFTNTSLYKLGNIFRFTECIFNNESGKIKYVLSQIESNKILNKIIRLCKKGAYIDDIIKIIINEGYDVEESKEYIYLLIDSQIIIDNLSASTVGVIPEKFLLEEYSINKDSDEFNFLNKINNLVIDIDNSGFKKSFIKTKELESVLSQKLPKSDKIYFHKEIYFDSQGYDFENAKIIKEALDHLSFIGKTIQPANTRISKFIDSYRKRYGDSVRKLTDVVDIESGIGYGNFLNSGGIDDSDMLFGLKNSPNVLPSIDLIDIDAFLINKIKNNSNAKEIILKEEELEFYKKKSERRNYEGATFSFNCNIYQNDNENKYIYLSSVGGNATRLIGRFTNGKSDIKELAKEISLHETNHYSSYVCAELDYIPESSLGNVIQRDQFRDFKISLLGGVEQDISIDDLFIHIEYNKVIISTKEGRKIMPFFSNAFNLHHPKNLPLFELLVDILNQFEVTNASFFDIKHYHAFLNHIPRISIKNTILSRESWMISLENLNISKDNVFTEILAIKIQNYLKSISVPQNFIIADGDNELVINIENVTALEVFFNELKKKKSVIIYEWLLNEFNSIVTSPKNEVHYNNEFLILGKNINNALPNLQLKLDTKNTDISANKTPFSEWVYFKIDIGNKTVDNFLINLYGLGQKLIKTLVIKEFFYIKYVEDSFQLRVRFLLTDRSKYINLLNYVVPFIEKYIIRKQIIKFSLETYERELLRYSGIKIIKFETIFFNDSLLSIRMIKKSKATEKPVWLYCLEYIYILLKSVLDDDAMVYNYIELMKKSFDEEFNANKHTTKSINLKYGRYIEEIQKIVIRNDYSLKLQDKNLINVIELITKLKDEDENKIFINLSNIIHMHIIRVVQNENRLYEYLIYSFIYKAIKTKKYIFVR